MKPRLTLVVDNTGRLNRRQRRTGTPSKRPVQSPPPRGMSVEDTDYVVALAICQLRDLPLTYAEKEARVRAALAGDAAR